MAARAGESPVLVGALECLREATTSDKARTERSTTSGFFSPVMSSLDGSEVAGTPSFLQPSMKYSAFVLWLVNPSFGTGTKFGCIAFKALG